MNCWPKSLVYSGTTYICFQQYVYTANIDIDIGAIREVRYRTELLYRYQKQSESGLNGFIPIFLLPYWNKWVHSDISCCDLGITTMDVGIWISQDISNIWFIQYLFYGLMIYICPMIFLKFCCFLHWKHILTWTFNTKFKAFIFLSCLHRSITIYVIVAIVRNAALFGRVILTRHCFSLCYTL